MRRILTAALLAAPLLLAAPGSAQAFGDGPCSYGYGCGGLCLNLFSRIHQHGPLYNYGPYCGYPPFDPYGPWDSYLHYNGGDSGAAGKGGKAKVLNPHPLFAGGLFHKHKGGDCDAGCGTGGCGSAAPAAAAPAATAYGPYPVNPYAGYSGYGYGGQGGYGYNPYAAAANAYYGPYMAQPLPYQPYQPGLVPAGMPGR